MTIERMDSTDRMNRIVKHNNTVYLSGQTAADEAWDITEQTQRCLQKVEDLLKDAGSSADKLLMVTIYVRDMNDFAAMNKVWDAWVADKPKPARACVEAHMARPCVLVDLSVTAAQ